MSSKLNNSPTATMHEDTAAPIDDETAILDLYQDLLDSWGSGDGYAYAAQFTADADYIAFDGTHFKARQSIASSHQQLFDAFLKGTRLEGQVKSIRFLCPEVALVIASGGMLMPGRSKIPSGRRSIHTLVATKHDGVWRFTAFHNNRVRHRNLLQNIFFGIATLVFRR